MESAESVVRSFFDALGVSGNMVAAMEEYLDDACVWENTGLPTAPDKTACVGAMKAFVDGMGADLMEVELKALGVDGEKVLTERVDLVRDAGGTELVAIAVSGTLTVAAGKIVHWSDYFDPRAFLR